MKTKSGFQATLFIMLTCSLCNGQTEKSNILIGGQTNLSFLSHTTSVKANGISSNYDKTKSFGFSPELGYFFSKNLLAGIMIPFSISKTRQISDDSYYKSFSFQLIPLIQKYFGNKKIKPFIFVAGGLGWGNTISGVQINSPSYETNYKLYTLKSGGGVTFFINDMISFDCNLGYSYDTDAVKSAVPGIPNSDHSIIQKGFTSEIGIYFYLQ